MSEPRGGQWACAELSVLLRHWHPDGVAINELLAAGVSLRRVATLYSISATTCLPLLREFATDERAVKEFATLLESMHLSNVFLYLPEPQRRVCFTAANTVASDALTHHFLQNLTAALQLLIELSAQPYALGGRWQLADAEQLATNTALFAHIVTSLTTYLRASAA